MANYMAKEYIYDDPGVFYSARKAHIHTHTHTYRHTHTQ